MIRVYEKDEKMDMRVPIKSWCSDLENSAYEQALTLSMLPFVNNHVALMPDCHAGMGVPIGSVIATEDVVIPNAVGVDIGCGMRFVKSDYRVEEITTEQIKRIIGMARKIIPVGFNHQKNPIQWEEFDSAPLNIPIIKSEIESSKFQLGTLGGGNHFIEIQKSDDGFVCFMIHSGSRNFGLKICNYYHSVAEYFCEKYYSDIPDKKLSFLPLGTEDGNNYFYAMEFALMFARQNRNIMMLNLMDCAYTILKCDFTNLYDVHHNYASKENHFGKDVIVHRKGAISATKSELGIIPGSMGTPSYIVEGLGNRDSFCSASHGAGRKMSRTNASKTLTVEEADKSMEGIVYGRWGNNRKGDIDLGEAPAAYKDIEEVIENETDLVKPILKLWPLGVMKG